MNSELCQNSELWERIEAFVAAGQYGEVTELQLAEFEQLLRDNEEAQDLYADLVEMSVLLPHALTGMLGERNDEAVEPSFASALPLAVSSVDSHFGLPSSVFGLLDSGVHGTVAFFSQEAPFGFLIASIILVIALWVGSMITVNYETPVAMQPGTRSDKTVAASNEKDSGGEDSSENGLGRKIEDVGRVIGRITDSADCRWSRAGKTGRHADSNSAANQKSIVSLGDTFAIVSGLLEISYDTGAKVILQGPCTYRVEAISGGFLAVGKLTAKLEKKPAQHARSNTQSPSLPVSQSPGLFFVRTPTATVTDLGTEFGVETDGKTTRTHVFVGAVEVMRAIGNQGKSEIVRLAQNQSVTVSHSSIARTTEKSDGRRFVRVIPPALRHIVNELSDGRIVFHERFGENSDTPAAVYRNFIFDLKGREAVETAVEPQASDKDGKRGSLKKEIKKTMLPSTAVTHRGVLELHRRSADEASVNHDSVILTRPFSNRVVVAVDVGLNVEKTGRACSIVRVGPYDFSIFPSEASDEGRSELQIEGPGLTTAEKIAIPFVPEVGRMHHVFVCFDGRRVYRIFVIDGVNPSNVFETTFDAPRQVANPFSVGVRCRGLSCTAMFANFRVIQFPWDVGVRIENQQFHYVALHDIP